MKAVFALALLASLAFVFVSPASANAIVPGPGDAAQGIISGIVFGLLWLFSLIAGVVVALQTWFLQVILSISFGLVNSAPVRVGFPVVLSIANLAFVAGLIVMAVATILRQDQYGVKKILWKLVVMAIAVNFGLVICGAMLGVSDNLTLFFVESVIPSEGGEEGEDYTAFATRMAGAFNPVNALTSPEDIVRNPALSAEELSGVGRLGTEFGEILAPLVSVLATLGTFVIIIITLGTLSVLLLYRYVKIGILLITLPLAWTAFVFPSYQSHFKKWWEDFTKWTIFPPVAVFFIWLGLQVSAIMNDQNGEFEPLYLSESSSGFLQQLSEFFGNLFGDIVGQVLKVIILFGIMMGGLTAAHGMGIKGAEAGIKAIEGANKGAKEWAGRRTHSARARTGAAAQRGALKTSAWTMGKLESLRLPFLNTKKRIDDRGKVHRFRGRAEKAPEELASNKLRLQAEKNRDALEERLSPGGSLKQRRGETIEQWQQRLAKRDKKLGIQKTRDESEDEWNARFNRETEKIVQENPDLERNYDENESYEDWRARITRAHPGLKRREAYEANEEWRKRIEGGIANIEQEHLSKQGEKGKDRGLLASIFHGANQGWKKGKGHKELSQKELNELLEKMGVHVPHEEHGESGGGGHGPQKEAHH